MSDVPKSKRSKSPLEVIHRGFKIRRDIVFEMKRQFGLTKEKLYAFIEYRTRNITDEELRKKTIERVYASECAFYRWFIEHEQERLSDNIQALTTHLHAANTIYPKYYAEFIERRIEMDRAMVACNCLQDELQYILEVLPIDKNMLNIIVKDVQEEFMMIKSLRQTDNRFLKELVDYSGPIPSEVDRSYKRKKNEWKKGNKQSVDQKYAPRSTTEVQNSDNIPEQNNVSTGFEEKYNQTYNPGVGITGKPTQVQTLENYQQYQSQIDRYEQFYTEETPPTSIQSDPEFNSSMYNYGEQQNVQIMSQVAEQQVSSVDGNSVYMYQNQW